MAKKDLWMPLNIGDYLADTMSLTAEQHGVYLLLLMDYWKSGPLMDDDRQLAATGRVSNKSWKTEIGPIIRRFFSVGEDGHLHQKRADAEISKTGRISEARRNAANGNNKPTAKPPTNDVQNNSKPDAKPPENDQQTDSKTGGIARVYALAPPSPSQRKKDSGSLRSPVVPSVEINDPGFDRFWAIYPRKDAKIDARKAWVQARRLASEAEIVAGLERYPFNSDPTLQKLPAGWLRQGRWQFEGNTPPRTVALSRQTGGASDMAVELNLDLLTPIGDQFPREEHNDGVNARIAAPTSAE